MLRPNVDSFASWQFVKAQVDQAVRRGELSKEKAHSILAEARESYRNQNANRAIDNARRNTEK